MYNTDKHWENWGKQDPYFAVLATEKFRTERLGQNREEFFASGVQTVSGLISMATSHFGSLNDGMALDFGSGVGRLTIPLASHFQKVVGVEISRSMIEEAKRNCANCSITSVEFAQSDDELSAVTARFDFIISCLVLQHIQPKRGLRIVARLAQCLNKGGVIALQFPIRYQMQRLERIVYTTKQSIPFSRYLFNLVQRRRIKEPLMQMNEYDILKVVETIFENGIRDFALTLCDHDRTRSVILMGRS